MVIISKPLFYSKIGPEITCQMALHEWSTNCLTADLNVILQHFVPGVFYFYFSIYLIKLLIERKKINKEYLQSFVKSYLRSECFGLSFGFLVLYTICVSSKIIGRIHYEAISLLAGLVSGLSIFWESHDNRTLNSLLWASLVVEALFKNAYYFKIIKYSPLRETVMFMLVNSLLMHLLSKKDKQKFMRIWFYVPSTTHNDQKAFNTKDLIEIFKYFGIGYGLSSAKPIISSLLNIHKNSIGALFKAIFKKRHFKFGMFFGGYVALFKCSLYFLQKYNINNNNKPAIAGLVAGMAYYVRPMTSLLAMGIITILQILIKRFTTLPKIPFTELNYMICNAILFQNRLVAPVTCPPYYTNMISMASKGYFDRVYNNLVTKYIVNSNSK